MKKCKLNWRYCECGCKSYEAEYLGFQFSYFWDLKNGHYLEVGFHNRIGVFSSSEDVDKAAIKYAEENYRPQNGLVKTTDLEKLRNRLRRRKNKAKDVDEGAYHYAIQELTKLMEE